jgi:hypothetical protein
MGRWMRGRLRRRSLRRPRRRLHGRATCRGCLGCRNGFRDRFRRLALGARHGRGDGSWCFGRRSRDSRGACRNLLGSQRLRVAHGGIGLLKQLCGRGGAGIGARYRRNGEKAERDRCDEDAGAHTGMFAPASPARYRPGGRSLSPHPGGSQGARFGIGASSSPRRPASTAASTRLPTSSFRIALLRYSLTVCRLR